MTKLTTLL